MRARGLFALVALIALLAVPAGAGAAVPQYLGAQTHPFWSNTNTTDFDHELDLLQGANANVVRVDISWSSLQLTGKSAYDSGYTAKVDRFMNDAAARGIKVIGTLYTTPCWASSAPDTLKQACAGSWWDRGVQWYPPANPADYADAAAWVAARWGSKMAALEVWNEPNLSNSFNSANPAADYAAMLKAAYPAVKLAAPLLPVLGGAIAFSDGDFLTALYAQGIQGSFDGLSIHPYNEWRDPRDPWQTAYRKYTYLTGVPWMHDIMSTHGDGLKKLWLTELGWSSCLPGGTDKWCVTETQQAQYIPDALRIIRDNWDYVDAAVVYNLRNKGTTLTDRESSFGMLYRDFTEKPAFASWKAAIAELRSTVVTPPPPPPPPVNLTPTIALKQPLPGSTFTSNVCFSATATDDTAVTKVEFRFDGKLLATDTTAPYSYTWNVPKNTSYGTHTAAAIAYDGAGLSATSQASITRTKTSSKCIVATIAARKRAGAQAFPLHTKPVRKAHRKSRRHTHRHR